MQDTFLVYNPLTKEGIEIYTRNNSSGWFNEKDKDLIEAFFLRNVWTIMKISDTDDLLDEMYESNGINLSSLSKEEKEIYIKGVN